jgi:hypothetical protein
VVLHNKSTGAEVHAVTAKNGGFRFVTLDAGEYTLEANEPQLGHGELEGILVTGGAEARVQAAMHFEAAAPEPVEAATPSEIAAPQRAAASLPLTASWLPATASGLPAATSALTAPNLTAAALESRPSKEGRGPAILVQAPSSAHAALNMASLSTASPQAVASLTSAPLGTVSVASRTPGSIRQPAEPRPLRAQPAVIGGRSLAAQAALPSLELRAALETKSIPSELALAVTLPRTLPLTRSMTPVLPLSMAVANGLNAVLLLEQTAFSPAATAAQKTDPGNAAATTTLTAAQLESLPAGGRRWQEFLLDTPAASTGTDSSQGAYRGSQESAEITIDGANTSLRFGATAGSGATDTDRESAGADEQSATSQSWTGGRGFGVSEAAIHEVTATAGNVEAEGVRSAGGRTGIRTERGGDALHGQEFYYDRQNTWGARNPFTQWVTETAPAVLTYNPSGPPLSVPVFGNGPAGSPQSYSPPDHETVWGMGVGGRIRRDKLFWFAALDSYHRNDPGVSMVKHPYLVETLSGCTGGPCTQTTGLFAQPSDCQMQLLSAQLGLTAPGSSSGCVSGLVQGLTAYSHMLETLTGLLGPAPRSAAQWVGFGRIDWQAAERHHFTLEGTGADWNAPGGGLTQVSENYGNHSFGSSRASQQWLLARWEAYLTPNLLAVTQGSAGRAILTARPDTPSTFEQTFLSGNSWGQLPQIVVDSRYGLTIGNPSRFGQGSYPDEKLYHAQEMLDWVHNHVLIRAGLELDHNSDATSLLRNQTGTYTYSKVEDFISDVLVFQQFGLQDPNNSSVQHSCGATDTTLGSQPCYSHYSQTIGPTNWHLSTNDWAGYATAQWQAGKYAVFSAGLRWELEQLPPPIAALDNPELPFTERLPALGNNLGPRVSVAVGGGKRWPALRLGYGIYYGRVENATIETALTQTGSLKGDLNFFMRPQDDCQHCSGGAPPFPYVLAGQPSSVVKPGADGFAFNFRNPEVHQGVAAIEQPLPKRVKLTVGAMLSLGRRLPVFIDNNLVPPTSTQTITYDVCDEAPAGTGNSKCGNLGLGPIKATQITVPFYASTASVGADGWLNPDYQQINQIASKANSTYEAAMVKLTRYGNRGLILHAHYTYAHAMDWNPDESPLNPTNLSPASDFSQEYGTSNLDVRHSAAAMVIYVTPWKLRDVAGRFGNGWALSGIGQFRSGLPYTMRVAGSLPEEFDTNGDAIVGLGPGMNGSGGDNRVYGLGNDGQVYNIGRNTFRYPSAWKADLRLGKRFDLSEMRQLELLVESFNLFNHQNVTEIETTGYTIEPGSPPSTLGASATSPTLNFLTGLRTNSTTGVPLAAFGQPININGTNFYRERQIQFGLRVRF